MRLDVTFTANNIHIYRDGAGRIFFDETCSSPDKHLEAPTHNGDERRRCQKELADLIPREAFYGPGDIEIVVSYTPRKP